MMKQEALFNKLGNILKELNDQFQFLSQHPEQLSDLELELFLANANFLADHIQIIKKLIPISERNSLAESANINEEIVAENTEIEIVNTVAIAVESEQNSRFDETENLLGIEALTGTNFKDLINKETFSEDKFEFEEKSAEQLFNRKLSKEEEQILAYRKKVKENLIRNPNELHIDEIGPEPFLMVNKQEKANEPINQSETVLLAIEEVELASSEKVEAISDDIKPTLNDVLAAKTVSNRINDTSLTYISDLKSAISLNDKLLFIKDMFNGYNLAYAEAIEIINKMPNFESADNFLQVNYSEKNNWVQNQATVDKFYHILNRRFKE